MDLTIVVGSCDKYSFLWSKFIERFNKFWDDKIDVEKYIITETLDVLDDNFKTLKCGNVSYTKCLKNALENLNSKYILWMQDDYFLVKKLDNHIITDCYNFIEKQNNTIRVGIQLQSKYYTSKKYENTKFNKFSKNTMYSISMQSSIWNREKLLEFLNNSPDENPWQFELNGSKRLNKTDYDVFFYELKEGWYKEAMKKGKPTEIFYK